MFTHRRSQGATNPLSRTEEGTRGGGPPGPPRRPGVGGGGFFGGAPPGQKRAAPREAGAGPRFGTGEGGGGSSRPVSDDA